MKTILCCLTLLSVACWESKPKGNLTALQGMWECTTALRKGAVDEDTVGVHVKIDSDQLEFLYERGTKFCRIELLEAKSSPKRFVWRQTWIKGSNIEIEFKGIYVLEGDTMMMCLPDSTSSPRPKHFSSSTDDGQVLMIFKKRKPE